MDYQTATLIALFLGPVSAVAITLWHQRRTEKRASKERLFITLMAHRKSFPPTFDWAQALNLIDVVYAKHPKIVKLWHDLYDILCQVPISDQKFNHKYLDLLSAMAKVLGYKTLHQTDIDKFYSPQAHGTHAQQQQELAQELLRVLKASGSIGTTPRVPDA